MTGTNANNLTNPAVSASGQLDSTLIEKFTGIVQEAFLKEDKFESDFRVQTVVGTNQVTTKSMGDTVVDTLTAGQEPAAHSAEFDNHSIVIDTVLLARNTVAMLHNIQSDIEVQNRLAMNQVKQLVRIEDETLLQQIIRGAQEKYGRVSGHYGGTVVKLAAANDENDPIKFLKALRRVVQHMNEKEVEHAAMKIVIPFQQFYVLQDNDHLTNIDYNGAAGNGGGATGFILKAVGLNLIPTNRFGLVAQVTKKSTWFVDKAAGDTLPKTHPLAKGGMSRYNVTADDMTAVALVYGGDALLVGKTIEIQSDIYFNKRLKTFFIDSWFSFGAIADRYEYCGIVVTAAYSKAGHSGIDFRP